MRYLWCSNQDVRLSNCMHAGFEGPSFPADLLRFAIVANITDISNSSLANIVSTKVCHQASQAFPPLRRHRCISSQALTWHDLPSLLFDMICSTNLHQYVTKYWHMKFWYESGTISLEVNYWRISVLSSYTACLRCSQCSTS